MKAKFEFELPEETEEFRLHVQASEMHSVIWDLQQRLRNYEKHSEKTPGEKDRLIAELEQLIWSIDLCG